MKIQPCGQDDTEAISEVVTAFSISARTTSSLFLKVFEVSFGKCSTAIDDFGYEIDDRHYCYLEMELCQGKTLDETMFKKFEHVRQFIIGLLKSLIELNGMIRHFDLHSKNIMINDDGSVKIIDYEAMDICSVEPFDIREECAFLDPDCVTPNVWWKKQKFGHGLKSWMTMKWEEAKSCKSLDEVCIIYSSNQKAVVLQ